VQSHVPSEPATSVLLLAAAGAWYCRAYGVDPVSGRGIALHRDAGNGWPRGFSKETPVSCCRRHNFGVLSDFCFASFQNVRGAQHQASPCYQRRCYSQRRAQHQKNEKRHFKLLIDLDCIPVLEYYDDLDIDRPLGKCNLSASTMNKPKNSRPPFVHCLRIDLIDHAMNSYVKLVLRVGKSIGYG